MALTHLPSDHVRKELSHWRTILTPLQASHSTVACIETSGYCTNAPTFVRANSVLHFCNILGCCHNVGLFWLFLVSLYLPPSTELLMPFQQFCLWNTHFNMQHAFFREFRLVDNSRHLGSERRLVVPVWTGSGSVTPTFSLVTLFPFAVMRPLCYTAHGWQLLCH